MKLPELPPRRDPENLEAHDSLLSLAITLIILGIIGVALGAFFVAWGPP